jgi:hypothetical protein
MWLVLLLSFSYETNCNVFLVFLFCCVVWWMFNCQWLYCSIVLNSVICITNAQDILFAAVLVSF